MVNSLVKLQKILKLQENAIKHSGFMSEIPPLQRNITIRSIQRATSIIKGIKNIKEIRIPGRKSHLMKRQTKSPGTYCMVVRKIQKNNYYF